MEGHPTSPTPHPRQPLTPSTTITPSGKKPTSIRPLTAAYQAAASQHQVRLMIYINCLCFGHVVKYHVMSNA